MAKAPTAKVIDDFLGSTQVFASALRSVVEENLLREVAPQVTLSQFKLLKMVAMTDSQTLGDVAAFLGVSDPAASKAVDKLVGRGLLVRREGSKDRRAIELSLTEASRRLLVAYEGEKNRKLAKVFRKFSPRDLSRASEVLDRLSAGIVDHTAKAEEICLQCGIYYREKCLVRQLVRRSCFYHRHRNTRHATSGLRRKEAE